MFSDIKLLLKKSIKRAGADNQINEIQIIKIFSKLSEDLLPADLASQVRPVSYKNGILFVASLSPAAVQEMLSYNKKIIKEINNKLGSKIVKDIQYIT